MQEHQTGPLEQKEWFKVDKDNKPKFSREDKEENRISKETPLTVDHSRGKATINFENKNKDVEVYKKYYAKVLKNNPAKRTFSPGAVKKSKTSNIKKQKEKNALSLSVHNLASDITYKEVWDFFKCKGVISDIILPKKRDRKNTRYGFVISINLSKAERIIKDSHLSVLRGRKILVKFANQREINKDNVSQDP